MDLGKIVDGFLSFSPGVGSFFPRGTDRAEAALVFRASGTLKNWLSGVMTALGWQVDLKCLPFLFSEMYWFHFFRSLNSFFCTPP